VGKTRWEISTGASKVKQTSLTADAEAKKQAGNETLDETTSIPVSERG